MSPLHIRFFCISMSLLIALGQCGLGISSLLCFCTGERTVALFGGASDPCTDSAVAVCESEADDCCSGGSCTEEVATDIVSFDKTPCSASTFDYVKVEGSAIIPAFDWALDLDMVHWALPGLFLHAPLRCSEENISVPCDRGPPIRELSVFLSWIQSYLL